MQVYITLARLAKLRFSGSLPGTITIGLYAYMGLYNTSSYSRKPLRATPLGSFSEKRIAQLSNR